MLKKYLLPSIILIFSSIFFVYLTLNYYIYLTSFSIGIMKYVLCVSLWFYIDFFFLDKVNTIEKVSEHPIAYAIFVLSNSIILGLCIATS